MYRVALTGNIASGKSAVAEAWARAGIPIIDADVLAREAVAPGTPGLRRVTDLFGAAVIREDGSLDRAAVRDMVFSDDERRRALERVLHPEIARLRDAEESRLRAAGSELVVHVIPLLFETGLDDRFDVIVLVDAPADVRRERIVSARGLAPAEAEAMIAAQMPAEQKRRRAHHIIDNVAGLSELEAAAAQVWSQIQLRGA